MSTINTATKLMVIRHAEKPVLRHMTYYHGVLETGEQDDESLIVRGWQRCLFQLKRDRKEPGVLTKIPPIWFAGA